MNSQKILLTILIILIFGNFIFLVNYFKPNFTGKVIENSDDFGEIVFITKVIDGDTVVANGESIRLLGMDSDERGYPCYKEAKKRLEELILDKEVRLETGNEDRDYYNRLLRYIFFDDKNINIQLVEEGLAVARFYKDKKYKKEILNAEKNSRLNKIGCKWEN